MHAKAYSLIPTPTPCRDRLSAHHLADDTICSSRSSSWRARLELSARDARALPGERASIGARRSVAGAAARAGGRPAAAAGAAAAAMAGAAAAAMGGTAAAGAAAAASGFGARKLRYESALSGAAAAGGGVGVRPGGGPSSAAMSKLLPLAVML